MSETIKVETTKDASGKNILEIKNMHTWFHMDSGIVKSVDGVDIELKEGSTLGIVGESGCGKSVTSMSLLGLLGPGGSVKEGSICYEDRDLLTLSEKELDQIRGKEISMIFQDPMTSLNPLLTIGEQISEACRQHEKCSKKEAKKRGIIK